ncbi:MAG TPA: response regulator [Dehalococcoidia bacterium]|nr:response regulator [Dehalococcoidia bacterium]
MKEKEDVRMPRIPIVDGAAFVRTRCEQALGEKGYELVEVVDGTGMLERYVDNHPDAVFMDIIVSHMGGMTAPRRLLEIDPGAGVDMASVIGQHSVIIEALESGASDFLIKPSDSEMVVDTVQKPVG